MQSGVELEQSRPAAIFGEIGGQMLAAIALVMPGIGPIVAAGPLAAELGKMADTPQAVSFPCSRPRVSHRSAPKRYSAS